MTKARSNATANAAKGDLTVGNGTNLSGVLAVGSNGDTIVADASTATGLRYQVGNGLAQGVINGGQDIWQRGTSISITNSRKYAVDRFECFTDNAGLSGTISRQTSGLTGIQYCSRVQRTAGNTNTNTIIFNSNLESENSFQYAGQTVTISFYARAGANFSAASNVLAYYLFSGTGSNQNVNSGFTGQATVTSGGSTLTTSWQRFSYTGTVSASATQLAIWFQYTASGTAGANDYFEITGIQLEVGSVATAFRRAGGTIQGELAACQRYYWRQNGASGNYSVAGNGFGATSTLIKYQVKSPTTMRVTPTSVDWSGIYGWDYVGLYAASAIAIEYANENWANVSVTTSGITVHRPYGLLLSYPNQYIGFSAEL